MVLREQLRASSERLRNDFERTTRALQQNLDRGEAREAALRDVLGRWLPPKYSVGRGEVLSATGDSTGQLDIIIYDGHNNPTIFQATDSPLVVPVESVYATVEVKSRLDQAAINAAVGQTLRLYALPRQETVLGLGGLISRFTIKPITVLFAFDSTPDMEVLTRAWGSNMSALPFSLRMNMMCLLGKGCFMYVPPERNAWSMGTREDDTPTFVEAGDDALLLFVLGLLSAMGKAPGLPVSDWPAYIGPQTFNVLTYSPPPSPPEEPLVE